MEDGVEVTLKNTTIFIKYRHDELCYQTVISRDLYKNHRLFDLKIVKLKFCLVYTDYQQYTPSFQTQTIDFYGHIYQDTTFSPTRNRMEGRSNHKPKEYKL